MAKHSTHSLRTLPEGLQSHGSDGLAASCHANAVVIDERLGGRISPATLWLARFSAIPPEHFRRVGIKVIAGEERLVVAARENRTDAPGADTVHLGLTFEIEGDRIAQLRVVAADFEIASLPVRSFLEAVNLLDEQRLIEVFADDAIVNDDLLEYADQASVRSWIRRSVIGERLALCPMGVDDRGDRVKLRASLEGEFDKRGLPEPLLVTLYFSARGPHITQLIILRNLCDL